MSWPEFVLLAVAVPSGMASLLTIGFLVGWDLAKKRAKQ